MKKTTLAAILLSFGAAAVSCGDKQATSDLSWGHLDQFDAKHPFYLINKKPGEIYKVCMARYMLEEIPGIEEELKAAINIWGAYLGRTIPVEIVVKDLARPSASQMDASEQGKGYYETCNEGQKKLLNWDLVVGLSPLGGSTVGQTGYWYMTSGNKVVDFRRYLFLRDFKTSPDKNIFLPTKRWSSMEEVSQKPSNSQDLLDTMLARNVTKYANPGTSIAFQVLVHEVGHIWGLCDQYTGGVGNCSKVSDWKSEHPDTNSMMAAASNVSKIFLSDDDITGIRKMAVRTGFAETWPGTEDDILRDPREM